MTSTALLVSHEEPIERARHARPRAARWPIAVPAALTALMGAFWLTRPFQLTGIHGTTSSGHGYDDAVYLGAAIRLIHGELPYRDFLLLHPPGIAILFSPVAAITEFSGIPVGLAVARIVTLLIAVANVALVAHLARRHGVLASLVAGLGFALFPLASSATHTLLLDPYVLFFALAGLALLFRDGDTSWRRAAGAGALFGLSVSIKIWAAPVLIAALVVVAIRNRKRLAPLMAGMVAAAGAICLPFLIAAPSGFVRQVIVLQFQRPNFGITLPAKLQMTTGLSSLEFIGIPTWSGVVVVSGLVVFAAMRLWPRRSELSSVDLAIVLAAATSTAAVILTRQFFDHYTYVPVAFLVLTVVIVLPLDRLRAVPKPAALAVVVLAVIAGLANSFHYTNAYLAGSFSIAETVRNVVPAGSCFVVDNAAFKMQGDRFTSSKPNCPAAIDPFAEWIAGTDTKYPYVGTYPTTFVKSWADRLNAADYVGFVAARTNFVPWTPQLTSWFDANFTVAGQTDHIVIYRHSGTTPLPEFVALTGSADDLVNQGVAREQAGDVDGAMNLYLSAMSIDPQNKFARFDAGHIYQSRGQQAQAEAEYVAALRIDRNFVSALYNFAVLKADSDRELAMSLYQRVTQLDPSNAAAKFNLGVLVYRSGDQTTGAQFVREAIAQNPSLAAAVPSDVTP